MKKIPNLTKIKYSSGKHEKWEGLLRGNYKQKRTFLLAHFEISEEYKTFSHKEEIPSCENKKKLEKKSIHYHYTWQWIESKTKNKIIGLRNSELWQTKI